MVVFNHTAGIHYTGIIYANSRHTGLSIIMQKLGKLQLKSQNKSSGKKILNTTFYPDQKGINKFIKGKSELKGNKQVKRENFKFENAKNFLPIVRMTKRLCDHL